MKYKTRGFTLIELLAVIVVLAIIMVIAGSRIIKVINKTRVDSFVSSYNMVVNAVSKKLELGVADINLLECNSTTSCASIYDLDIKSEEYDLKVVKSSNDLMVAMTGTSGGKFEDIKINNADVSNVSNAYSLYNRDGGEKNNSIATKININNGNISQALLTDLFELKLAIDPNVIKNINDIKAYLNNNANIYKYVNNDVKWYDRYCDTNKYDYSVRYFFPEQYRSLFTTDKYKEVYLNIIHTDDMLKKYCFKNDMAFPAVMVCTDANKEAREAYLPQANSLCY